MSRPARKRRAKAGREARAIQSVDAELKKLMQPEEIDRWLKTKNQEFHGHSPADLIQRGEVEQLQRSLFYLRTGMPD